MKDILSFWQVLAAATESSLIPPVREIVIMYFEGSFARCTSFSFINISQQFHGKKSSEELDRAYWFDADTSCKGQFCEV
jgi:hypothetical protein